ncbi:hypothetical protein PCASD_23387 [Puccinia coronata f. sp. avenae]|uniref:Uncharacterized protein n=1 Tax=Puccinia coronata f. sp. avenae TaxID=200324 RepID=A0A2N5SK83_9BASI|nr:hypothetical protein PCASD_23387 [Puccinia coronata f. sp. avenae]
MVNTNTAGINRSNTAVRAVLEQPCSTGGRMGTVRPKQEPTGRTDLSDRSRLVLCDQSQELIRQACPTRRQCNAKTHWPEGKHDPSEYDEDYESSSGNDHELVMTSRSRSSNGVRTPFNDWYRPVIKKNQSSRGACLLLMTGLHQPLRGGIILLMAGLSWSSRGERTPVDNLGRPVIKRSTPPLDDRTALAIERRRPPLDGRSVLVIKRSTLWNYSF